MRNHGSSQRPWVLWGPYGILPPSGYIFTVLRGVWVPAPGGARSTQRNPSRHARAQNPRPVGHPPGGERIREPRVPLAKPPHPPDHHQHNV
ncbi:JM162 [macacine gammaherpesvirus 11]|uniref:JM162 n=2 Tax=macacine gammaherpesvirus 11 TaxID=2560570 RepID=G9JMG9_9GAMA|nr:JM162 [Macaca fuscata rhadinovirus]AAT00139.1 JM162 [Macaca fuscata rhadinovirus]AEW87686.1 JM162 [Macaca fuscata rhadinovirus]AEW87856.1 JM162 [Macaca fuscata rhadinovirus]